MTAWVLSRKYPARYSLLRSSSSLITSSKRRMGSSPTSPPHVVPGRELERQRRQPLLPLRPERGEVHPAEQDLEVVPVRSHGGRAALDVGAVRLSERLGVLFEGRTMPVAYRGLLGAI